MKWIEEKNYVEIDFTSFFKLYFIDYAITVAPILPPLLPSTQQPPQPQAIPTSLFVSMDHAYVLWLLHSYTVLYILMAIL